MILTVTLNPALDVTYELDRLQVGEVHRVEAVHERIGGKGVNVASVLTQMGEPVRAVGAGDSSIAERLRRQGIEAEFAPVLAGLRRTVVARAGDEITSLWEPGRQALDGADQAVVDLVRNHLTDASVLVISGSLAPGLDASLPARLIAEVGRDVPVIADLDGEPLRRVVEAGGAIVMPNRDELAGLGCVVDGRVDGVADGVEQVAEVVARLSRRTGAAVIATLGVDGLVGCREDQQWSVVPERLAGNPTGAGDATAAGVARGLARGARWPDALVDAAALGGAAVLSPVAGLVDLAAYRDFAARWSAAPIGQRVGER